MATAAVDILDGPTGQLLLASHALATVGRSVAADYDLEFFSDARTAETVLVRAVSAIVSDPIALSAFVGPELLHRLGEISDGFHHGYATKGREGVAFLGSISPVLRPLEQAIARSASNKWWWSTVGETQVLTESATGARLDRHTATYDTADGWWTAPQTASTLMSTRGPVGDWPSVAAVCGEDLAVDSPRTRSFITPAGPVFEICGPEDFVGLVEQYPRQWRDSFGEWKRMTGADGPWIGPDWEAVASDYAGVHLTVAGYLSTAYRALPAAEGLTHLAGWDPDGTVWLRQPPSTTAW